MSARTALLTAVAMLAFAANSLLARVAVRDDLIDAYSFTAIRLLSGAAALALLLIWRSSSEGSARRALGNLQGSYTAALALFVYAAGFSVAYLSLSAGTGALLLFGAVQLSMIGVGLARGERMRVRQWSGLAIAVVGLVVLLLPGLNAPPLGAAVAMLIAGVAWGVYSLLGRGAADPTATTAGNFIRAAPLALLLWALAVTSAAPAVAGVFYAVVSGVLASAAGYAVWYAALPTLSAPVAASVQLSVPVIAAAGGALLLGEAWSLRLLLASVAVLGGVALVILSPASDSD